MTNQPTPVLRDTTRKGQVELGGLSLEEKRALLAQHLGRRRVREYPAAFPQQRMWFLDQLMPGNTANNLPRAVRITGPLDLDVWKRAVHRIVERHEALRTTFREEDGAPVQVVHPWLEPGFVVEDRPNLHEATGRDALESLAQQEFSRAFDLEHGPLLRLRFLRVSPTDHVLLVTIHHIAADLWSTSLFLTELAVLYDAFSSGTEPFLPEPALQYADYSQWQRTQVDGGGFDADLEYWRATLSDAPAALDLPTDRPRPAVQGTRGSSVPFEVDAVLFERVRSLSRELGATPFMVVLAAFDALLSRLTRTDVVVVGVPTANRERQELAEVIGYFVTMLPMRVRVDHAASFRSLVAATKTVALDAYAHQDLPFDRLVEAVQPARDASRSPLFQVSFVYQNIAMPTFSSGGLSVEPLDVTSRTARFDLELQVFEEDGLRGWFEYSTDLFNEETVVRWGHHLLVLLDAAVSSPETPVGELPLLAPEDERSLAELGSGPERSWAAPHRVDEMVFEHVRTAPHRTALSGPDESLDYAELARRVDALASVLRDRGVGRGSLVGICLERSPLMVVSLLAVLRAGAAYVPIDPGFPEDRVELMIADSGLTPIITSEELAGRFASTSVDVLVPSSDRAAAGTPTAVFTPTQVEPEDPSYLIYTSGSTGRPKGVLIPHRALTNFLRSMAEVPGAGPDDTLVAVTTFSFDISMLELLLPLIVGGHVVVAPREVAVDASRLADLLDDSGASLMQATPTTWRMLLDLGWAPRDGFRVLVGGEALPPTLAADLVELRIPVWNMYGPTETTIWSSVGPVTSGPVRLGPPIANTLLEVVEPDGRPAPIGVPGELWISGDGLAVGYWEQPELTAERFVDRAERGRWYRTGDLTRRHGDGSLEFIGRLDHQVKLRGYRIELGEIESVLRRHDAVKEAVATVREDVPGDQRLTAYLLLHEGVDGPSAAELRELLAQHVPDYMVPSVFVELAAFPTTPNGKVNRSALPAPERTHGHDVGAVPPRTAVERVLARIWEDVLGVDGIGAEDDFFALGGHSLLSTRVLVRTRAAFGIDVPLQTIFRDPTVAGLARALTRLCADPGAVERTAEIILELDEMDDEAVAAALSGSEEGEAP